jgi:hypothetical protein
MNNSRYHAAYYVFENELVIEYKIGFYLIKYELKNNSTDTQIEHIIINGSADSLDYQFEYETIEKKDNDQLYDQLYDHVCYQMNAKIIEINHYKKESAYYNKILHISDVIENIIYIEDLLIEKDNEHVFNYVKTKFNNIVSDMKINMNVRHKNGQPTFIYEKTHNTTDFISYPTNNDKIYNNNPLSTQELNEKEKFCMLKIKSLFKVKYWSKNPYKRSLTEYVDPTDLSIRYILMDRLLNGSIHHIFGKIFIASNQNIIIHKNLNIIDIKYSDNESYIKNKPHWEIRCNINNIRNYIDNINMCTYTVIYTNDLDIALTLIICYLIKYTTKDEPIQIINILRNINPNLFISDEYMNIIQGFYWKTHIYNSN